MKLSTMTIRALNRCLHETLGWIDSSDTRWIKEPPKEIVAKLKYYDLLAAHGIGKLGRRDVVAWLAESGLSLQDMPVPAVVRPSQARIDDSVAFLERWGYTVIPPKNEGG